MTKGGEPAKSFVKSQGMTSSVFLFERTLGEAAVKFGWRVAAKKAATSASNGWLAERLGMGKPASVSQFVRRLMADDEGRRACEGILSKVKGLLPNVPG